MTKLTMSLDITLKLIKGLTTRQSNGINKSEMTFKSYKMNNNFFSVILKSLI